jgi:hypothetical protein
VPQQSELDFAYYLRLVEINVGFSLLRAQDFDRYPEISSCLGVDQSWQKYI